MCLNRVCFQITTVVASLVCREEAPKGSRWVMNSLVARVCVVDRFYIIVTHFLFLVDFGVVGGGCVVFHVAGLEVLFEPGNASSLSNAEIVTEARSAPLLL